MTNRIAIRQLRLLHPPQDKPHDGYVVMPVRRYAVVSPFGSIVCELVDESKAMARAKNLNHMRDMEKTGKERSDFVTGGKS